jgi:hypothetical protein
MMFLLTDLELILLLLAKTTTKQHVLGMSDE